MEELKPLAVSDPALPPALSAGQYRKRRRQRAAVIVRREWRREINWVSPVVALVGALVAGIANGNLVVALLAGVGTFLTAVILTLIGYYVHGWSAAPRELQNEDAEAYRAAIAEATVERDKLIQTWSTSLHQERLQWERDREALKSNHREALAEQTAAIDELHVAASAREERIAALTSQRIVVGGAVSEDDRAAQGKGKWLLLVVRATAGSVTPVPLCYGELVEFCDENRNGVDLLSNGQAVPLAWGGWKGHGELVLRQSGSEG